MDDAVLQDHGGCTGPGGDVEHVARGIGGKDDPFVGIAVAGEFFEFNADDKLKLIDTLRKEGFVCLENDAIIQKACGDS